MAPERRSPNAERTDAERTRAREERERRRAQRRGEPAPPPLPAPEPGPPPVPEPQPPPGPPEPAPPPSFSQPPEPVLLPPARPMRVAFETPRAAPAHPDYPWPRAQAHRVHLPRARWGTRNEVGHKAGSTIFGRAASLLAVVLALAALAGGALLLIRRAERKSPPAPAAPRIVKVLIPEGYTADQIDTLVREDGLRGNYLQAVGAASHRGELRPPDYGAPRRTHSLEGFLFPASYELYEHTSAARLVSEQLAAFRANFGGGEVDRARKLGITPYEMLSVASIVEREAGTAHDRPLVAAVIYNRLRAGMTLGVDATLRYALHDFEHPLTEAQLATNTPYNTRLHRGLPPTPISNPGAAAIRAAARPAHVSYLYYVAGADGCGELVFSTGYAQFERNAAAYREALARNGGNVPKCKHK